MYLTLSSASRTPEEQRQKGPGEEARKMGGAQEGDWEGFSPSALPSQSLFVSKLTPFCWELCGAWREVVPTGRSASMSNHRWHSPRQQSPWLGFRASQSSPSNTTDGLLGGLGQVSLWASVFPAVKLDYYHLLRPTHFTQTCVRGTSRLYPRIRVATSRLMRGTPPSSSFTGKGEGSGPAAHRTRSGVPFLGGRMEPRSLHSALPTPLPLL